MEGVKLKQVHKINSVEIDDDGWAEIETEKDKRITRNDF